MVVLIVESLLLAHPLGVVKGELIGQQLQQILRATLADATVIAVVGLLNSLTKELHLAPEVVVKAPADKVAYRMLPFHAVGHIEHTGLQPGNHTGTVRQVPIGLVLIQPGYLGTFLLQCLRQPECLLTDHQSASGQKVVDIGFQGLVECRVIQSVHRLFAANLLFRNHTEVDARNGAIGQHLLEEAAPLEDGRARVPVEPAPGTCRDAGSADTRLSVGSIRVEG